MLWKWTTSFINQKALREHRPLPVLTHIGIFTINISPAFISSKYLDSLTMKTYHYRVPTRPGKPGKWSTRFPVMENVWKMRKNIKYAQMLKMVLSCNVKESLKKFLDPDGDPDHSQNLIICFLSQSGHFLKNSSKSVHNFLSNVANRETNKQTLAIT